MRINWTKFVFAILICQLAGVIGNVFTNVSVDDWYQTLQKPSFTPPGGVIGIVWTILFLLVGISLYIVWNKFPQNKNSKQALIIFGIQLVLNILWSAFFFGLRNPLLAFIEILVLGLAIIANMLAFYKVSKISSYLLIPYLLWVSFASYLNFSLWKINA